MGSCCWNPAQWLGQFTGSTTFPIYGTRSWCRQVIWCIGTGGTTFSIGQSFIQWWVSLCCCITTRGDSCSYEPVLSPRTSQLSCRKVSKISNGLLRKVSATRHKCNDWIMIHFNILWKSASEYIYFSVVKMIWSRDSDWPWMVIAHFNNWGPCGNLSTAS